jgi:hypothetical protein
MPHSMSPMRLRHHLQEMTLRFLQRHDLHVFRTRFDNPVPDVNDLAKRTDFWERESAMAGIDMNLERQLALWAEVATFRDECNFPSHPQQPHEYCVGPSPSFGLLSATLLHGLIRHFRPARMLEIGSGNSTFVAARAARMNEPDGHPLELVVIDPFPEPNAVRGYPGLSRVLPHRVQDVDQSHFQRLQSNDFLFIDSSHVVATGNDVVFLFLEILPRLAPGVIVHVHDIFFPFDYPRQWVIENRWYWNEQYLLQAFLSGNRSFEVLLGENYLKSKALQALEEAVPGITRPEANGDSNSFWMRKIA